MTSHRTVRFAFVFGTILSPLVALSIGQTVAQEPAPKAGKSAPVVLPKEVVDGTEEVTNLLYATYGDRKLELDLYRPRDAKVPLPGIVCVHGGGWWKGDRKSDTNMARALAARGYVTVTIDYRLSKEAPFPAHIHDCKAAVRWLRANAEKYGVDPKEIGVIGLSAGGHLTALLATSGGVAELEGDGGNAEQSSQVQAAIAMGAQTDLTVPRIQERSESAGESLFRDFLGGTYAQAKANYVAASPVTYLDSSDPPLMFITGELDDESTRAADARKKLEELGIATGLVLMPNGPHAFQYRSPWHEQTVDEADKFFATHLKHGAAK